MTKSKPKQTLVQDQDKKPSEIELPDHIDLRPLYRSVQYVDEAGNPVNPLRGIYETGDGGGKCPYAIKEYEGYRNFFKNTVWLTQADLLNFELSKEETDLVELNRRVLPLSKTSSKGEYSSLWGRDGEFDGPTKINHLLTQNQTEGFGIWGKVGDGCGENKIKHGSPTYHPISFDPKYEYWDEGHYLKLFRLKEKSLDTYNLPDPIYSKCTSTKRNISSHVIYINPNNNQVYIFCTECFDHNQKWPWHRLQDHRIIEDIADYLGLELIKYKKAEIDEDILDIVRGSPGINKYQLAQDLDLTKGRVTRGIDRLRKKHLIHTRRNGKQICVYPILKETGTDLLYNKGEKAKEVSIPETLPLPTTAPDPDQDAISEQEIFRLLEDHFIAAKTNNIENRCIGCGQKLTYQNMYRTDKNDPFSGLCCWSCIDDKFLLNLKLEWRNSHGKH